MHRACGFAAGLPPATASRGPQRYRGDPGQPCYASSVESWLAEGGGGCLPADSVAVNAVLALELHHHHGRRPRRDCVRDGGLEPGAVSHRAVDEVVKPRDLRKIE